MFDTPPSYNQYSRYDCSHLHKGVLTVSVKSVPVGVKGLVVSISINLTLPRTRLVSAVPLAPTTDTGMQEYRSLCAAASPTS